MLMEKARTLEERRLHHQIIADNINRDYLSKAEEKVYRTVKKQEAAVLSKQVIYWGKVVCQLRTAGEVQRAGWVAEGTAGQD